MNSEDTRSKLAKLLNNLIEKEKCADSLEKSNTNIADIQNHFLGKLYDYDQIHKEAFITENLGMPPTEPKGLIKFVVPVYLSKKSKYKKTLQKYQKLYPLAESAYRNEYRTERNALEQQDELEKEKALHSIREKTTVLKKHHDEIMKAIEFDNTLSDRLKKKEIVSEILGYFDDGRVSTLKEAVNLWYDEQRKSEAERKEDEHRERLIVLEEEKLRAAQATEEYQKRQCEIVEQAAQYAKEAAENAQQISLNMQMKQLSNYLDDN